MLFLLSSFQFSYSSTEEYEMKQGEMVGGELKRELDAQKRVKQHP